MTAKEIRKGNKLIAEFMGGIYSKIAKAWGFGKAHIDTRTITIRGKKHKNLVWAQRFETELKYHSDWNWLMEVVVKISHNHSYYQSNDSGEWQIIIDIACVNVVSKDLMEATWLAVVKFIKWYNQQHK